MQAGYEKIAIFDEYLAFSSASVSSDLKALYKSVDVYLENNTR